MPSGVLGKRQERGSPQRAQSRWGLETSIPAKISVEADMEFPPGVYILGMPALVKYGFQGPINCSG